MSHSLYVLILAWLYFIIIGIIFALNQDHRYTLVQNSVLELKQHINMLKTETRINC